MEEIKNFAILLNSQEELDACIKWAENNGYTEYSCYNTFKDQSPCYFITNYNNNWYCLNTAAGKPIKTLSEVGITVENTPQFEVGKWYKITLNNCYNHFIKFKSFDLHKGYIDDLGYISNLNKFEKGHSVNLKDITDYYKLTNLSEIQLYLPDNHPDKIVKQENMEPFAILLNSQEEYKVGDWVLLSNYAEGWGAHSDEINNKILQITRIDLNDNPTSDSKGRYYFGDIRTIGKEIVRKALPHEIPQENNNSIPEYVEYIDTKYKGQIVKVEDWTSNTWCKVVFSHGQKEQPFKHLVKSSTKEAYKAQFQQNSISNNDIIEVGDIAYYEKPEQKYLILADNGNSIRIRWLFNDSLGYKIGTEMDYRFSLTMINSMPAWKLYQKASQTTNYIHEKQVEEQPTNVPTTTDIRIPKSISVTLKNTEKEVKLTIKKPKLIKI